jgi:hypothetical protein
LAQVWSHKQFFAELLDFIDNCEYVELSEMESAFLSLPQVLDLVRDFNRTDPPLYKKSRLFDSRSNPDRPWSILNGDGQVVDSDQPFTVMSCISSLSCNEFEHSSVCSTVDAEATHWFQSKSQKVPSSGIHPMDR